MPLNNQVLDIKPQNIRIDPLKSTEQLFNVTINAGQSMGLLLALTYPTTFTVISNRTS